MLRLAFLLISIILDLLMSSIDLIHVFTQGAGRGTLRFVGFDMDITAFFLSGPCFFFYLVDEFFFCDAGQAEPRQPRSYSYADRTNLLAPIAHHFVHGSKSNAANERSEIG